VGRTYPSQEQLKQLMRYDPEVGKFFWLNTRNSRVMAGDEAGWISRSGVYIRISGSNFPAHCLAYLYVTGSLPSKGCNIDHENGNNLDNRWINLRKATYSQNSCNRAPQSNSKTGVKNVCFHQGLSKWRVQVSSKAHGRYQGLFKDFELACLVAEEARALYHKNFARG